MEPIQAKSLVLENGNSLRFVTVPNSLALASPALEGTDLESGVYEGGLKVWDCSLDLVRFVGARPGLTRGKRVLELGCGQGLPGIAALQFGQAATLTLQDFNKEVLDCATGPCLDLNGVDKDRVRLVHGSWATVAAQLGKHDLILMSETLYNPEYYEQLVACIDAALSEEEGAEVVIGTKTFYYGVGGGYYEFRKYLEGEGGFTLEVVEKINDMKSIERLILRMKRENRGSRGPWQS